MRILILILGFKGLTPFLPFSPSAEPGPRLILDDRLSFLQTSSLISHRLCNICSTGVALYLRRLKKTPDKKKSLKNLQNNGGDPKV